jgi:hypothetical protein
MEPAFVWANVREATMSVNRITYGTAVYKDVYKKASDDWINLKGTRKRRDKVMLDAFESGTQIVVTEHVGRKNYMPRLYGYGRIVAVNEGDADAFREFTVELTHRFPDSKHERATKPEGELNHCWIKRAFMREMRFEPVSGNLMCFANKCRRLSEPVSDEAAPVSDEAAPVSAADEESRP